MKTSKHPAVPGNLIAMLQDLTALRAQVAGLEASIQTEAARQQREAEGVLDKLLGRTPRRAGRSARVAKAAAPQLRATPRPKALGPVLPAVLAGVRDGRGGQVDRILIYLRELGTDGSVPEITAGIGLAVTPPNTKRVAIALYGLRNSGRVEGGKGVWRLGTGPAGHRKPKDKAAPAADGDAAGKHKRAIAWAKANPDDPRSAKILALHQQ